MAERVVGGLPCDGKPAQGVFGGRGLKARPRIFPTPPNRRQLARCRWPVRVMSMRLWARLQMLNLALKPVGQMDSPDRFFVQETER